MNARQLMHLTCQDCEKPFDEVCFPHRPYMYCPTCRQKRNAESGRRTSGFTGVPSGGKKPFTVIKHDGPGVFPAGAYFPGNQMMLLIRARHIEGAVVETCNKRFLVEKGRLVPV